MRRDPVVICSPLRNWRRQADSMGMPAHTQSYHTVDEVLAFPEDGNRYELIFGELVVSPTPRFWQPVVVMRLTELLLAYCRREHVGKVFCTGADLSWGRTDTITNPDVFVLDVQDMKVARWADVRHVPLIAEVLGASTARHDRYGKRIVYRDQRVGSYWIIDADKHSVDVWTPEAQFPTIERERVTWFPVGASQPLVIVLAELFADA